MRRFFIIASAVIFFILTLLKLTSPDMAALLRERLLPAVNSGTDYKEAFVYLGEKMTEAGGELETALQSLFGRAFNESGESRAASAETGECVTEADDDEDGAVVSLDRRAEGTAENGKPDGAANTEPGCDTNSETVAVFGTSVTVHTPSPSALSATAQPACDENNSEVLAAFLQSQEEYSDYALPSNVSYTMPDIPFEYVKPVSAEYSSCFGFRVHPVYGKVSFHYGSDFAASEGDEISAFHDGVVALAGEYGNYGNCVVLKHAEGWQTLYGHCSRVLVTVGQSVTQGELIACVGHTGNATGPHLHFELTRDAVYYNPELYFA